ncbi:carboxylesterase [Rhodobacteraceae bacterium 63075]|nr:carboxylesterase [Rhodobacteraceae bacterium 63075]
MGVMERVMTMIFGGGRNVVKETAEVFRENAEAGAWRDARLREAALEQFAQEFALPRQSLFNRIMDGVNRLPRPLMALGTIGLFVAAMVHPVWFAERMQGIALVPEPLWWLLGAVVSFYFGARHQAKGQELQRQLAETLAHTPRMARNMIMLDGLPSGASAPGNAATGSDATLTIQAGKPEANAALNDWRANPSPGR